MPIKLIISHDFVNENVSGCDIVILGIVSGISLPIGNKKGAPYKERLFT